MSFSLIEKEPARKSGYSPDLNDMLSQCELNYWLMKQLLPVELEQGSLQSTDNNVWTFEAQSMQMVFTVTDVARYTTTMTLSITTPQIDLLSYADLIIRMYHDARMVEVMEGTGPSAMQAINEQLGGRKAVDEKQQVNRFIGECLRACYQHTRAQQAYSGSE